MSPLADMSLPGKHFGLHTEDTASADAFVLITLAFLFFVLGIGAVSAWLLWQRKHRPKPHVKLLIELEEERQARQSVSIGGGEEDSQGPAWERTADWWKKES